MMRLMSETVSIFVMAPRSQPAPPARPGSALPNGPIPNTGLANTDRARLVRRPESVTPRHAESARGAQ
jgi:hypothetical protein